MSRSATPERKRKLTIDYGSSPLKMEDIMVGPMTATLGKIRKVAVELPGKTTQLFKLDQGRPLADIISELCQIWDLTEPENYSLKFTLPQIPVYITEENREEIRDGNQLCLTLSPIKTSQDICQRFQGEYDVTALLEPLRRLWGLSDDITFAKAFIAEDGLFRLMNLATSIEGASNSSEALTFSLRAFLLLMEKGEVSWDVVDSRFLKMIMNHVRGKAEFRDDTVGEMALTILEATVRNSHEKYQAVEQVIRISNLVDHLKSSNRIIQTKALAIINTFFRNADRGKRKTLAVFLQSRPCRIIFHMYVLANRTASTIDPEMAHQLYVTETYLLSLLQERMYMRPNLEDMTLEKQLRRSRTIAFGEDTESDDPFSAKCRRKSIASDYKKLGFQNENNPLNDFELVPPGILAFDNITFFANSYDEAYSRVVLENSCRNDGHAYEFVSASIAITRTLCNIMKIGESPREDGRMFHPLFLIQDRPFAELFCVCIQLFIKTWKDMKARRGDLGKVMAVVSEQIGRALECQPYTFVELSNRLQQFSYADITNIWRQELSQKEDGKLLATPILDLKERIKPEILKLIQHQRIQHLVDGAKFDKPSKGHRGKGKQWYCRLAPNTKYLHYTDAMQDEMPPTEVFENKVAIKDITDIDVQSTKDKSKHPKHVTHSFTLHINNDEGGETLTFIPSSDIEFHMWTDGINALLGNQMTSILTKQDVDMLLSMEIKLHLLDLEGITVPEESPQIPEPPDNFDFGV